jgi:hypothetical protein
LKCGFRNYLSRSLEESACFDGMSDDVGWVLWSYFCTITLSWFLIKVKSSWKKSVFIS